MYPLFLYFRFWKM